MGNVEYDNTLRLAPNAYQVGLNAWDGSGFGNGAGLNYDTVHEATFASRVGSLAINSLDPNNFKFPKTHSFSLSYARRIFFNQVVEGSYVGTRGRDLVSRTNGNVMPYGAMLTGTFNGIDLSNPVNRVCGRDRLGEPQCVPQVQRAERHHHLRLRRRVRLQFDAADVEPPDRTPPAVFRRLHAGQEPGHARRRIQHHRSLRCQPHLRRAALGSHAHPQRLVERVPARRREGLESDREGRAERLAAVGHHFARERHPDHADLHRRRRQRRDRDHLLRHRRRGRTEQHRRQRPERRPIPATRA